MSTLHNADIAFAYAAGFQAGADAARRECAGIAEDKAFTRCAKREQAGKGACGVEIAAAILERVGKPVKEETS